MTNYSGLALSEGSNRTSARVLADRISVSLIITLSSLIFMISVPFLPSDTPSGKSTSFALALLISIGLGVLSYFGKEIISASILWLIALLSILWHMFNIGLLVFIDPRLMPRYFAFSLLLSVILMLIVVSLLAAMRNSLAFSVSVFALALTLTPFYYIAIPIMILPILLRRNNMVIPLVFPLIGMLTPFLVAENSLSISKAGQPGQITWEYLKGFAAEYRPNVFTHMIGVADIIREIGPLPAIDPASLFVLLVDKYLSYLKAAQHVIGVSQPPQQGAEILTPVFTGIIGGGELASIVVSKLTTAVIALGVIIAISSLVSAYIPSILRRLPTLEEKTGLLSIIEPTIVMILGSSVFYILLALLSPPLRLDSSLLRRPLDVFAMIMISGIIGGALSAKEYLVIRAEDIERTRSRIMEKIAMLEGIIKSVSGELGSARASTGLEFKEEEAYIADAMIYISEARSRVGVVGLSILRSIEEGIDDYLDRVQKIQGSVKNKILNSLSMLAAIAQRGNNQLESIGIGRVFPDPDEVSISEKIEKIVGVYNSYVFNLRASLEKIYSLYIRAIDSLSALLPGDVIAKPATSPLSLYDLGSRGEALSLTIDLWIRLGEIYWDRVRQGIEEVRRYLGEISGNLDPTLASRASKISEDLSGILSRGVASAPEIQPILSEIASLASDIAGGIRSDIEYIEDLAKDLSPEALRVLRFSVFQELGDVERISSMVRDFNGSILSAIEILRSLSTIVKTHRIAMRQDEEKILLLIAYPIARSFLDEQLSIRGSVYITELPFSPQASAIYAKIYSETNRGVQYIEHMGVVERIQG